MSRGAADLSSETSPEGTRGLNRPLATELRVGHEEARPAGWDGELEEEVLDGLLANVELLANCKLCCHGDCVPSLIELHEGRNGDGRGLVGLDAGPKDLKRVAINRGEHQLSCGLVLLLIYAWMKNDVAQPHLS